MFKKGDLVTPNPNCSTMAWYTRDYPHLLSMGVSYKVGEVEHCIYRGEPRYSIIRVDVKFVALYNKNLLPAIPLKIEDFV
jgi:hypothetical protein